MPASADYPVLLFHVRLETRFTAAHLLVWTYPDQHVVDTHESELTASELRAGREYRDAVTDAADKDRRAARRELARRTAAKYWHALVRVILGAATQSEVTVCTRWTLSRRSLRYRQCNQNAWSEGIILR